MINKSVKAPSFKLRNQNNEWVSLDDYQGERVFIFFCGKINDIHTLTLIISYILGLEVFEEAGVKILAIIGSSVQELAVKSKELRVPFPLLSDESTEVRKAYDVWKYKSTFGTFRWVTTRCALIVDEKGIVEKVFKRINTEQYARPVMKYIEHKHQKKEWRKLSRRTKERIRREQSMGYNQTERIGPKARTIKVLD